MKKYGTNLFLRLLFLMMLCSIASPSIAGNLPYKQRLDRVLTVYESLMMLPDQKLPCKLLSEPGGTEIEEITEPLLVRELRRENFKGTEFSYIKSGQKLGWTISDNITEKNISEIPEICRNYLYTLLNLAIKDGAIVRYKIRNNKTKKLIIFVYSGSWKKLGRCDDFLKMCAQMWQTDLEDREIVIKDYATMQALSQYNID